MAEVPHLEDEDSTVVDLPEEVEDRTVMPRTIVPSRVEIRGRRVSVTEIEPEAEEISEARDMISQPMWHPFSSSSSQRDYLLLQLLREVRFTR